MSISIEPMVGVRDWRWINDAIPILQVEDTEGIVAFICDNPAAAVVFDNWTQKSVQAHIAILKPIVLRHGFLEWCFDYVFNYRKKERIFGLVPSNNRRALAFNQRMGFTEQARLTEAFASGIDYVILELTKDNCNFIEV